MKEKLNFELVHLSLIAIMLGWLLYLNDGFNHWVVYILTNQIYLIV